MPAINAATQHMETSDVQKSAIPLEGMAVSCAATSLREERMTTAIITPCYNGAAKVATAIESALSQGAAEVIAIDDGSTDNSLAVIKSFAPRIKWATGPNGGVSAARNKGVELATSEFVMFMDADDYYEGPNLKSAEAAISSKPADIAFGPFVVEDNGNRVLHMPLDFTDHKTAVKSLLSQFHPPCGLIWRRSFLQGIGGWQHRQINEDLELVFRALGHRPRVTSWTEGNGVWVQHNDYFRLTSQADEKSMRIGFQVLQDIVPDIELAGYSTEEARGLVLPRTYVFMRHAARFGYRDAYRDFRARWKALGGADHTGSRSHIWLSRLLGLYGKERILRRLRAT